MITFCSLFEVGWLSQHSLICGVCWGFFFLLHLLLTAAFLGLTTRSPLHFLPYHWTWHILSLLSSEVFHPGSCFGSILWALHWPSYLCWWQVFFWSPGHTRLLPGLLSSRHRWPVANLLKGFSLEVFDVPEDLRLPHCILKMNNRVKEIIISQPIWTCWLCSGSLSLSYQTIWNNQANQ